MNDSQRNIKKKRVIKKHSHCMIPAPVKVTRFSPVYINLAYQQEVFLTSISRKIPLLNKLPTKANVEIIRKE